MTEHDAKKLYDRATNANTPGTVLHVRVMGRSRDIALDMLEIGSGSSDDAIREAVARFMEVPIGNLKDTVIERHENGNMTLRPEAVFG
jgi:hypothetical protein